jgi:hypothetical protein
MLWPAEHPFGSEHLFASDPSLILANDIPKKRSTEMTSPRTPESDAASPAAISCIEPDCERPVVQSVVRCRVHLAESLQSEGETIPFEDPELAGMLAAAIQIVRTALAGLPQELLSPSAPASRIDMYAVLDPDADWKLAQIALDFLGTHLSDTPPFGGMILSAPTEFMSKVMLRLQVAVPAHAADELLPRLRFAMEAMVREVVGPDVWVDVQPAEESDGPAA